MSNQTYKKQFKKIIKNIQDRLKPVYKEKERPGQARWMMERIDYLPLIQNMSWDDLGKIGHANIRKYQERINFYKKLQKQIAGLKTQLDLLDQVALHLDRGRKKAEMENKLKVLREELREKGVPAKQINKFLAEVKLLSAKSIAASVKASIEQGITEIETTQNDYLTSYMGAVLAAKVSAFNKACKKPPLPAKNISAWCKKVEMDLFNREKSIWNSLKNSNLNKLSGQASELNKYAELAINRGVVQAAAIASQRANTPENKANDAMALRIGDVLRALLRSLALGQQLEVLSKWDKSQAPIANWIRTAQKIQYSKSPAIRSVSVAEFVKKKSLRQGAPVAIHGCVQSLAIKHIKSKAVSSASIGGKASDAVLVGLPYIKLDSAGLVPQSYVRISGTWTKKLDGVNKPGILIDRLNYGNLSKKNGYDWVTAELRSVFDIAPHGLAVGWSWQAGVDGPGNQLRYGTWYTKRRGDLV